MLEVSNLDYHKEFKVMTTVPYLYKIVDLFKDFEPAQNLNPADWLGVDFININRYSCDVSNVVFETFSLRWPKHDFRDYLSHKFDENICSTEQHIQHIEDVLGISQDSFSIYEEYFYFDLNGDFKVLREYAFQNAYDENADSINILIYENMNINEVLPEIESFYKETVTDYMNLPEELNKKISELSEDEIQLLRMYII